MRHIQTLFAGVCAHANKMMYGFAAIAITLMAVERTTTTEYLLEQRMRALGQMAAEINTEIDRQVDCLAKNIYWEARGEEIESRTMVGLITLARARDERWPDTVCTVVFQKNQFSWTRETALVASEPKEQDSWNAARRLARELYTRDVLFAVPEGWECVRFYKRADDHGVSERSRNWFQRNLIRVGTFGSHAAYATDTCESPIPTY